MIEWRALTVALLDELAPMVRARLATPELPLACINFEGGSWAAGGRSPPSGGGGARRWRSSDGTVF